MVLILTADGDFSADIVTDWLRFFKYPFRKVNALDIIRNNFVIESKHRKARFIHNDEVIELDQVGAVWYRKFGFYIDSDIYRKAVAVAERKILNEVMAKEFTTILQTVMGMLKQKSWLTNPYAVHLNKYLTLLKAEECGLSIPESYIVNSKKKVAELSYSELISKSILDSTILRSHGNVYSMYTTGISTDDFQKLPPSFFPSLLQKKIKKVYELRVFFLLNKCYAMAIFSQHDNQTSVDFRKYNWDKPNRYVPYTLPTTLHKSIAKLMNSLNLNCGSIDLIRADDGKYYFLEINPTGQFGMTDFPCNYGLHKKVAESLIQLDKKALN